MLTVVSNRIEAPKLSPQQLDQLLAMIGYLKAGGDLYYAKKRRYIDREADVMIMPTLRVRFIDGCLTLTPGSKMFGSKSIAELLKSDSSISKSLKGKSILCRANYMDYYCIAVDESVQANSGFIVNGEEITYAQYFGQRYGRKLDETKPFLKCRLAGGENVFLPAEYCHLGEPCSGKALSKAGGELYRFSQTIEGQMLSLENLLKEFNGVSISKLLENNKLTLGRKMIQTRANEFPQKNKINFQVDNGSPVNLNRILVVLPDDREIESQFRDFERQFIAMADEMNLQGINMALVRYVWAPNFEEWLTKTFLDSPSMAIVVIPNDSQIYAQVKSTSLNSEKYVPTQILTFETLRQCSEALSNGNKAAAAGVVQNVLCQIVAKLRPISWNTPRLDMDETLVVGISVGPVRCEANGQNKRNFAIVSSLNRTFDRWISRCHDNYDNSKRLSTSFKKALRNYKETHDALPTSILIFREGESNIAALNQEVTIIKEALEMVREVLAFVKPIKFAVLSVAKSPRIYAKQVSEGSVRQISSGAYVEINSSAFDLISAKEGVIEVCEYKMIHDEFQVGTEMYAEFASKLSYAYPGSCGKPSLFPTPVQCAIKLRRFIKAVGYEKVKNSLEKNCDKLFYL